jgi:predicted nucleotidyltransferase component of viral defense system
MVEVKKLTDMEFRHIVSLHRFNSMPLTKDYYLTWILYLLKDLEGLYFKGGTALNKIVLNYARLSEDVDYTVTSDLMLIKRQIKEILVKSGLFEEITQDKDVEGFTRLVAHYKGFSAETGRVFIDLNQRAKLSINPENHPILHFYEGNIPKFSCNTLAVEEMIAEKMAAAIGRNKPRDHFDLYMILKKNKDIDLNLVKKKCEQSGDEFNIIKMFNQAKKLKNRWDEDMLSLLREEVSFQEVIQTLAKHFKLKEEKDSRKNKDKSSNLAE